ncbi:hypothetical protein DOTSEDRAFT_28796 [Dothistroma septosporum NZE10]|uniref:Uncharacterized protein n=1 Tax=Dothistroma septosporum (strain NZE10 / CBS 128990) TaxID=675120 RepID=M2YLD0_DOTSN|nr:hypothetical protein DOTSEDRAFT_28796 [Dothistroma septosporum NZE10]
MNAEWQQQRWTAQKAHDQYRDRKEAEITALCNTLDAKRDLGRSGSSRPPAFRSLFANHGVAKTQREKYIARAYQSLGENVPSVPTYEDIAKQHSQTSETGDTLETPVAEEQQQVPDDLPQTNSEFQTVETAQSSPTRQPKAGANKSSRQALRKVQDYLKTKSKFIKPITIIRYMRKAERVALSLAELRRLYGRCVDAKDLGLARQKTSSRSTASSSVSDDTATTEAAPGETTREASDGIESPVDASSQSSTEAGDLVLESRPSASPAEKTSNPDHESALAVSSDRSIALFGSTECAATATVPLTTSSNSAFAPAIPITGFGKPSTPIPGTIAGSAC